VRAARGGGGPCYHRGAECAGAAARRSDSQSRLVIGQQYFGYRKMLYNIIIVVASAGAGRRNER